MLLNTFSDRRLSVAIEKNLIELGKYFGRTLRAEFCENLSTTWFLTGIPLAVYNAVVWTEMEEKELNSKIDMILSYFQMHSVPIMWWIGPSTRPKNLGKRLKYHGFVHAADLLGMAIDLTELQNRNRSQKEIIIKRVNNIKTLKDWVYTAAKGGKIPCYIANCIFEFEKELGFESDSPWQRYLGFFNEEPVATSGLFLGEETVGIYNVSTIVPFRRLGFGSAMTMKALQDAHDFGYSIGVLHDSTMGGDLYHKLGFQEYCIMSQYVYTKKENGRRNCMIKSTLNRLE